MNTLFWDRHADADKASMKALLMPLVAATRPRDFVDVGSARVQVLAFLQALSDVPKPIVEEAVTNLVQRGLTWMPKPGELKAECAKVMDRKRTAAMALHLEDCPHGSARMVENAHGRMEKCGCWRRAVEAANAIGRAIALPAPREDREMGVEG